MALQSGDRPRYLQQFLASIKEIAGYGPLRRELFSERVPKCTFPGYLLVWLRSSVSFLSS